MESRDSSSPLITRAVAAGLRDEYIDPYPFSHLQKLLLRFIGLMPRKIGLWIVPKAQAPGALAPSSVRGLKVDKLVETRLKDYSSLPGQFPAITIGAGMGGAAAHLGLALGGPFLPEAFVLTLKGGSKRGRTQEYFERSHQLALEIASSNPGVLTIQHFDPVHDGWLTRSVNHLRLKLTRLPESYKRFLLDRLALGGEVCYLQGGAQWLRYRVGDRSVFQVGGWGDISAREFLEGSPRLREFARRSGFADGEWALDGFPLEAGPESEWGSESDFAESLAEFCSQAGFRFQLIRFDHPEDFSRLAFMASEQLICQGGQQPAGVLIETFSQYDATAVRKAGLLPLWLIFNTKDSLRFLKKMRPFFPLKGSVLFSPLATFSETPDMASWQEWCRALEGMRWINVGARASHYPTDANALADWWYPLRVWAAANLQPVTGRLTIDELAALTKQVIELRPV